MRKLLARRFDAILTADGSVYYAMQQHGRDMSVLREGAVVQTTQLWLGPSLDDPGTELQAWRTAAARAHQQGRLDRIAAGYGVPPISGRMPS